MPDGNIQRPLDDIEAAIERGNQMLYDQLSSITEVLAKIALALERIAENQ